MREALQPGAEQPEPAQSGSARVQPQSQPSWLPYQEELQVQPAGAPPVPPVPVPPVPVPPVPVEFKQVCSAVCCEPQLEVVALPTTLQVNVAVSRQLCNVLNWPLHLLAERFCRLVQFVIQLDRVSFAHAGANVRAHTDEQLAPPVAPVPPVPPDPPLPLSQLASAVTCELQLEVVATPFWQV
jgi:hypothetical protein